MDEQIKPDIFGKDEPHLNIFNVISGLEEEGLSREDAEKLADLMDMDRLSPLKGERKEERDRLVEKLKQIKAEQGK